MILTKEGSSAEAAKRNLLPGYEIVKLEDLIADQGYLATLDDTGLTAQKITPFLIPKPD